MFLRDMLANVETKKPAGDATTVTSIIQRVTHVNAGTNRLIGVAKIATEIHPRATNATNVGTNKPTGIATIVAGTHLKGTLAKNVIISRLIGSAKTAIGIHPKDTHVRNVTTRKLIGPARNATGAHQMVTLVKSVEEKHDDLESNIKFDQNWKLNKNSNLFCYYFVF